MPVEFTFEAEESVSDVGAAHLSKYALTSFASVLTHEPCDRHNYAVSGASLTHSMHNILFHVLMLFIVRRPIGQGI